MQNRILDLVKAVERAEGDISSRQRWQRTRLRDRIGHPIAEEVRKIDDFLGEQPALVRRNQHRVGKKVVHRRKPSTGRLPPGGNLYWRWLTSESEQAVATHVADEIDQNIDAVSADQCGESIVSPPYRIVPF